MAHDPNDNSAVMPAGEVQSIPSAKLIPAAYAFLLALGWMGVMFAIPNAAEVHPRGPDNTWVVIFGASLLVIYPLAWVGFSAWRNRAGFRLWTWRRRALCGVRISLQPVYWIIGLLIPLGIMMPGYANYTVRAKLSEVVLGAAGFRSSIAERADANKTLVEAGANLVVEPIGKITAGLVSRDGIIVVYNDEFRVLLTFIPVIQGGNIKWTCDAMPAKYFPSTCRDKQATSYAQRDRGSPAEDALELLKRGAQWQAQVANSALSRGTLAGSAKTTIVRREGLLDFGLLDTNGRIALYSDRHGTFALLEPQLKDAQLSWRCRVWPTQAAPSGCSPAR